MILKKVNTVNSKKSVKIFKVILILLFIFGIIPNPLNAMNNSFNIVLPQKIAGIEKLEYLIDDVPMGNTAGKQSIVLNENQKINFLIKFEPESYKNLKASDVKIISQSGMSLPLNVYMYDENQNLVTKPVTNDELIDSNQTYVTSSINLSRDEVFQVSGIKIDTNTVFLKLSSDFESINNVLEVEYKTDNSEFKKAIFDENENSMIIKDIPDKSPLKLSLNLKDVYSNSKIKASSNEIDIQSNNNTIYIQSLKSDINITLDEIEKNKYTLNFIPPENGEFKSIDNSENLYNVNSVTHGTNYSFTYVPHGEKLELTFEGGTIEMTAQND